MKSKVTTNLTPVDFDALAKRYVKGDITSDEWSRMTPALRKKLERYEKKNK